MDLADLVGEHTLDAVEFSTNLSLDWGKAFLHGQAIRFRLDGIVYMAMEDPEDGYRSCMEELVVCDTAMTNVFPPHRVLATHETEDCDLLTLTDMVTGQTVLEVGTGNTDHWYPYFVANFCPEALAVNNR